MKVVCRSCTKPFEPSGESVTAWVESHQPFDPTDWECTSCEKQPDPFPLDAAPLAAELSDAGIEILSVKPVYSQVPAEENKTSREETPAYIARCKKCSAIVMATVDIPEHAEDVANAIADCVRRGFTIERVTVGYVRKHWSASCICGKTGVESTPIQATLFPMGQNE